VWYHNVKCVSVPEVGGSRAVAAGQVCAYRIGVAAGALGLYDFYLFLFIDLSNGIE